MEHQVVTIAIASCEDESRIEACLHRALSQDYPKDAVEIIVADGMSMDATREIVLRIANDHPNVRLVDNPRRTRAAALNTILEHSRGELIVPMDPGGDYARTHVTKCAEALSKSSADQLAIMPRTTGRTVRERAFAAVESTKLAFAAGAELTREADNVPALLGAIRRRVLDRVGWFDPGARCEEEVDLARRIRRSGGISALRRDIVVHLAGAAGYGDLFRRHFELGKTRARRVVKDRHVASIRELAPLAMVVFGGALAATATIQPLTPLAIAAYALMTGAAAVRIGRREGIVTIPAAWAAYPVMHLADGVGFGSGLVRSVLKPDWKDEPEPSAPVPA